MTAFIKAIAYYLPQPLLTNDMLAARFPGWSAETGAAKLGIVQRHISEKGETATDMAVKAADCLFNEHNIARESVDFVLLCTQSPDYFLPTSACLVQDRLGLSKSCGALDFNLGCSGFVYGLSLAKGLIVSGAAHNVLLLTAETYSKYINPEDKGNRSIFGDGASATLVSTEGFAEIGKFTLGTDGRGANNLIVKTGGSRNPYKSGGGSTSEDNLTSPDWLYMNGPEIFSFTLEVLPKLVRDNLSSNGLSLSDIDLFVFHQANKYILNFIRKKLRIPEDKFYYFLENVGNTVSSTIPIALSEAQKQGRLNGNVLLSGFGVGYSWGSVCLNCE